MDPRELSGSVAPPDHKELMGITRLHALVDKLEIAFCLDTCELGANQVTPDQYRQRPELRNNMRKAIFRVFISGAVLAGAYTEPFLEAKRKGLTQVNDLDLLKDFILYNPHVKSEAKVAEFEHLALWLVDDILSDSKSRQELETKMIDCGGSHNRCSRHRACAFRSPGNDDCISRHLVECNVMQMLWVYRHMWKTINPDADRFDWRTPHELKAQRQAQLRAAVSNPKDPNSVPFVLFGRFRVQHVTVSQILLARHTLGHLGYHEPYVLRDWGILSCNPQSDAILTIDQSVLTLLSWASRFTPHPTGNRHRTTVPLDFAFLDYVLKQYAGVRMIPEDAASMVSPVQLLGPGYNIDRFFWTFNVFVLTEDKFNMPLRSPQFFNNCLLMQGFNGHGNLSNRCKHIGATVHLAAAKCYYC